MLINEFTHYTSLFRLSLLCAWFLLSFFALLWPNIIIGALTVGAVARFFGHFFSPHPFVSYFIFHVVQANGRAASMAWPSYVGKISLAACDGITISLSSYSSSLEIFTNTYGFGYAVKQKRTKTKNETWSKMWRKYGDTWNIENEQDKQNERWAPASGTVAGKNLCMTLGNVQILNRCIRCEVR